MPRFGGFNEGDLEHLERTSQVSEGDVPTIAHISEKGGMRFGGRDDTKQHQVVTRIDHLEKRVIEHIRENLMPRVVEHSRISIKTDPVKFLYYQELSFGRRCSCWDSVNSGPDKRCPICFGRGWVGGYNKYGTSWHVLDCTHPSVIMVNVCPDFDSGKRPIPLSLLPTAVKGYIEFVVQTTPNTGVLDRLRLGAYAPQGSRVTPMIRTMEEAEFVPLSKDSVESRLNVNGRPSTIVIRIYLDRQTPNHKVPSCTFLHLRYRTRVDISIVADIPQREKSIELQEHGLMDVFDTIEMIVDGSLLNVSTGDMFIRVDNGERFKVIRTNQWTPEEFLVETSIRARHVNREESLYLIP